MPTNGTSNWAVIWRGLANIGLLSIACWFVRRILADVQTNAGGMARDITTGVTRDVAEVVAVAVNDAIRNQPPAILYRDEMPHLEDHPALVDDPTQGDGPVPWYADTVFANNGGPMTRPIDPTDIPWPDPISDDPAHRTTMIAPMVPEHVDEPVTEFGPDGFPAMPSWSAISQPDMSGETWQG